MKSTNFNLVRYDADEGFVFDWVEPHYIEVKNEEGILEEVQEHLYARTLFIGGNDTIDNYVEVEEPVVETTENI
jgi:hypothetical protein